MRLATWNVNSLKVRLPQTLDWLAQYQPDVLCLQETKSQDENFPSAAIAAAGYHPLYTGQKTYNGVALLSKQQTPGDVLTAIPDFDDPQKRVLAATYTKAGEGEIRVICVYVPNGDNIESDKYQYKLKWLRALRAWLQQELRRYPRLAVLGDFNIAPDDRDVYDPKLWAGQVLCSEPEREALRALLALGLHDSFRLFDQPDKSYTWWDYRMMGFRRNQGLRIDHILVSDALAKACTACVIDKATRKLDRPSDHAPLWADI